MIDLKEVWAYRQLVLFFVWRDLIVRYRQTIFGILWLLLRPLTMTFLLSLVFQHFNDQDTATIPYVFYALSGYLCWQFFASSATESGNSLINNISSINKVYYPRIVLPLSSTLTNLIELVISVLLLFIWLVFSKTSLALNAGWLVVSLFFLVLVTAGAGFLLSSLVVKFRDIKFILPFLLQAGILLSPIGFKPDTFAGLTSWLLFINPVTAPMELFRYSLFGQLFYSLPLLLSISLTQSIVIFIFGLYIFNLVQRNLADTL